MLFASQAAQVLANARAHREARRARADLEISPVGVAVFDMQTGVPVSFNRDTRRIVDGLRVSTIGGRRPSLPGAGGW